MDVFKLFENKNISDIKLGIQIVKSLGLEQQFEEYIKRPFIEYENVFNNVVLFILKDKQLGFELSVIFAFNLDLSRCYPNQIAEVISKHPKLINYFDLTNLDGNAIRLILVYQPQLVNHFNLSLVDSENMCWLLDRQPQLVTYFDLLKLNINDKNNLLILQPQLAQYFNKNGKS